MQNCRHDWVISVFTRLRMPSVDLPDAETAVTAPTRIVESNILDYRELLNGDYCNDRADRNSDMPSNHAYTPVIYLHVKLSRGEGSQSWPKRGEGFTFVNLMQRCSLLQSGNYDDFVGIID